MDLIVSGVRARGVSTDGRTARVRLIVLLACCLVSASMLACSGSSDDRDVDREDVGRAAPATAVDGTPTALPTVAGVVCAERARVLRIVDGDTVSIQIEGGGAKDTVRYIGIDSPEKGSPGFNEAAEANDRLVAGKTVCLERDITDRDRFGRLLRYAWLDDGTLVNEALLALGAAVISTYPPDVKYVETRFRAAQDQARKGGLGIWAPTAAAATKSPTTPSGGRGNCDPSYPTVCIPPPPPDLDCSDIPYRRFAVAGADPHRFDSDKDGIGCES